jgi:hypothetical protein
VEKYNVWRPGRAQRNNQPVIKNQAFTQKPETGWKKATMPNGIDANRRKRLFRGVWPAGHLQSAWGLHAIL